MPYTHPPYNYYLGPWQPSTDASFPGWVAPAGTVGLVDLASLPQIAGLGSPRHVGFFATTQTLDSSYTLLGNGDFREIAVTAAMQSAWKSQTGYKPQGAWLSDLLWDQLTNGADPAGQTAVRPLMPDATNGLEMYLGGHSLIHREAFVFGRHPLTSKVQAVEQSNYAAWYDSAKKRLSPAAHHRRCLDFLGQKYGVPDPENWFIPAGLPKELPLPHSTTINDNFNRANQSGLGTSSDGNWSWSAFVGASSLWTINTNAAQTLDATSGERKQTAAIDLSSADHYSLANTTILDTGSNDNSVGVIQRKDATATNTHYLGLNNKNPNQRRIFKCVAGTYSQLGTDSTDAYADGLVLKTQASGSTITLFYNGTQRLAQTDTTITGNLRTGIYGNNVPAVAGNYVMGDNFQGADLAAAPAFFQRSQMLSGGGMQRTGIYTSGGM